VANLINAVRRVQLWKDTEGQDLIEHSHGRVRGGRGGRYHAWGCDKY